MMNELHEVLKQRKKYDYQNHYSQNYLNIKVMSVDLGLYPVESSSSDEDMFTENVWWETGDNLAFINDQVRRENV